SGLAASVLARVMEKRGDRLILGPVFLEHERANAQEVPEVGDFAALAALVEVQRRRVVQRLDEALREDLALGDLVGDGGTLPAQRRGCCLGKADSAIVSPPCSTPAPTTRLREIVKACPRPRLGASSRLPPVARTRKRHALPSSGAAAWAIAA